MSQRNAKLVRKFIGRQAEHRVYVHRRSLVERLAGLPHGDRARLRGRLARRSGGPLVPLSGGKVLDLRSHALLLPNAPKTRGVRAVASRVKRAVDSISRVLLRRKGPEAAPA